MRIHYLQHVPFEDLANIWMWANNKGHSVSSTKLYLDEKLPAINSFDWLIVMGGPMNIYEEEKYPWLSRERRFIEDAIRADKFVLGICLGGQLVADVLGGKVQRGKHKEIGWFHVRKVDDGSGYFKAFPAEFMTFHWHGDAFDIPPGATRLVESDGCANQAFEYGKNVLGLQFHLESSEASIQHLIENCKEDMNVGKYVQIPDEIFSDRKYFPQLNDHMESLLDEIEKRIVI
jgi:GMP synthase-like glutamine amidotransferase